MAENNTSTVDQLKAEIASLRSQMEAMVKKADHNGREVASHVADRLGSEFDHYRRMASREGSQLLDRGEAGLEDVATLIRHNPLASLGIAFGAGWILSCLWRSLR